MRLAFLGICLLAWVHRAVAGDLHIAYVGALSGVMAIAYGHEKNGFMLAVDEYKARGGKVEAIVLDDSCSSALSQEKVRQALAVDRAFAVVGAACLKGADVMADLSDAGVLISTSAIDDVKSSGPNMFFLGTPAARGADMAKELALASKQEVDVRGDCFPDAAWEREHATVCPVLSARGPQWRDYQKSYHARFGVEPDRQSLVAYTAAKIALEALSRSGGRPREVAAILRRDRFDTAFGQVRPGDKNPLGAYWVLAPKPNASPGERGSLIDLTSKKGCNACTNRSECPQTGHRSLFYAEKKKDCCKKSDECPQGMLVIRQGVP